MRSRCELSSTAFDHRRAGSVHSVRASEFTRKNPGHIPRSALGIRVELGSLPSSHGWKSHDIRAESASEDWINLLARFGICVWMRRLYPRLRNATDGARRIGADHSQTEKPLRWEPIRHVLAVLVCGCANRGGTRDQQSRGQHGDVYTRRLPQRNHRGEPRPGHDPARESSGASTSGIAWRRRRPCPPTPRKGAARGPRANERVRSGALCA